MSQLQTDFSILNQSVKIGESSIETEDVLKAVLKSNVYIDTLYILFKELSFDLFDVLGQRNISGVIGEIFSRYLCSNSETLSINPHPDGRPDILQLPNYEIRKYFEEHCFINTNGKKTPKKTALTPFKYGGLEVKCTIGSPVTNYKKLLEKETGKKFFEMGHPRIKYLQSFNYWAHHRLSTRMFSLYYDYYKHKNNIPQLLAVSFCDLTEDDWNIVSLGSDTGKKTSNTSLNKNGKKKLYDGFILASNDSEYQEKFKELGIIR